MKKLILYAAYILITSSIYAENDTLDYNYDDFFKEYNLSDNLTENSTNDSLFQTFKNVGDTKDIGDYSDDLTSSSNVNDYNEFSGAVTETVTESATETVTESVTKFDMETITESDIKETVTEYNKKSDSKTVTETVSETVTETVTESETVTENESVWVEALSAVKDFFVPINDSNETVNDIIDHTFNKTNQKNNPWVLALDVIKNLFGSAKNISDGISWVLLRWIYGTTLVCTY